MGCRFGSYVAVLRIRHKTYGHTRKFQYIVLTAKITRHRFFVNALRGRSSMGMQMSGNTLTRAGLAESLVSEVGLSRQDSSDFVDRVFELMSDELAQGKSVKLSSFGAFHVRDKRQRMGRNPKTGEEVAIEPRRVVVFKSSQVLKDRVDSGNK